MSVSSCCANDGRHYGFAQASYNVGSILRAAASRAARALLRGPRHTPRSKQAVWEGPPFWGSFTILVVSFLGSLGVVPGFDRLVAYIAPVGHAFVEIVPH